MDPAEITSEERLVARRWMRLWQGADLTDFDALHAADFVDHSPAGRSPDLVGFKQGLRELYQAFPDFKASIDDLMVDSEGGKVSIRWSASGSHRGLFLGLEGSGRKLAFRGIEIIQIMGGRVQARWGEWNGLELLAQLGLGPGSKKS